ncbi:hypothetical protein ACKWTF_003425 [Chironomus riparius]
MWESEIVCVNTVSVKQIRIPRPKYSSSNGSSTLKSLIPREPPRDYDLDLTKNCRQETQKSQGMMSAEEMQRAFQEKL